MPAASPQKCEECGRVTAQGRLGDEGYEGRYFCDQCWRLWDAGFAEPPQDLGKRFPPGLEVVLEEVPGRPELRSRRARVVDEPWHRSEPGRLHVSLAGSGREVAVRPEALRPYEWTSEHWASCSELYARASAQLTESWAALLPSALQRALAAELRDEQGIEVLELGAGLGRDASYFAEELGAQVTALALCEPPAQVRELPCRGSISMHGPFDFSQLCDLAGVEARGWWQRFRLLWSNVCLAHLTKRELGELLEALHCTLRPGGLLAVVLPLAGSLRSSAEAGLVPPGCFLAAYSEQELAEVLRAAGWELRSVHAEDAGAWLQAVASSPAVARVSPCVRRLLGYHERSSLGPGGGARGGAMDWSQQPDKFLRFPGTRMVDLDPDAGGWVARVLRYAFGLSAWKGAGASRWSVRTNPSSGALQPLEFYVLGDERAIEEYSGPPALLHYHSYWHSLEVLHELPPELWAHCSRQLPAGSVLLAVSAFYWRNAWKYGEPGFRYVQQDVGHAIGSLGFAALSEGSCCALLEGVADAALAALLGLRDERPAAQQPQALLALAPSGAGGIDARNFRLPRQLCSAMAFSNPGACEGPLPAACCEGHRASWKTAAPEPGSSLWRARGPAAGAARLGRVELQRCIARRRSCHELDPSAWLELPAFLESLRASMPSAALFELLPYSRALVPLVLCFVRHVRGLAPGIYAFVRDEARLAWLKSKGITRAYAWQRLPEARSVPLYLLRAGDASPVAYQCAAQQDAARTGAVTCAVFMEYQPLLLDFGAWMYRRGHWEGGMVVQAMYLAAEAVGSQGTAMGAFLGPWTHRTLGVSSEHLKVVEFWAFGTAVGKGQPQAAASYGYLRGLRARARDALARDRVDTVPF